MFKRYLLIIGLAAVLAFPGAALAQEDSDLPPDERFPVEVTPPEEFYRAQVVEIISETRDDFAGTEILTQEVKIRYTSGPLKGQETVLRNDGTFNINAGTGVAVGETVIVYRTQIAGEDIYSIADTYRVPSLAIIVGIFFAVAVFFSRWKGLASILGLLLSIVVIVKIMVPQILAGHNPLLVTLLGALIISVVSIYLAHGFNRRTSIALASTLITLSLAAGLAGLFVSIGKLFGLGTEEAFYIQQLGPLQALNMRGLLLGGIILGALGVLDDITTAQSAAVDELKKANPSLTLKQLYAHGISIGREHISSLVNTLFLAYAGASLPLFLFFSANSPQPLWVTLNSEFLAEEIVRTMVGSIALILAVPITTVMAAYFFNRRPSDPGTAPAAAGTLHHH